MSVATNAGISMELQEKAAEAKMSKSDPKLILDLPPEPTENDAEADAMLYKLQRKIK